jgi:hypothetical protein
MAGIVNDEEIARIIAESDSDWASESDDSFETSLESDSSVSDRKPKVTVHRDSASSVSGESEFDTANGDLKEITDCDDTKTHNLKYSELQGPKHAPPQGAPPLSCFYMFFTVQLITALAHSVVYSYLQGILSVSLEDPKQMWKGYYHESLTNKMQHRGFSNYV